MMSVERQWANCNRRISASKSTNRKKRSYIEIQVLEVEKNNKVACIIPVVETKSQGKRNKKRAYLKGHIRRKKNIDKRKQVYKIIGQKHKIQWEIEGKVEGETLVYIEPEKLIDSKIQIINGERKIQGTVVKASIIGGGTTSPPAEGGLPPVDE